MQRFRFVVGGLLVVLASAVASYYAASAAVPSTLRPAGTTRYAVAGAQNQVTTQSTSFIPIPDMSQSIVIPSGKRGDVFVTFCGMSTIDLNSASLNVRAMVGNSLTMPEYVTLTSDTDESQTRCASFYKLNVAAGTKNIRMDWRITNGTATQYMYGRTMFVIVNLHN